VFDVKQGILIIEIRPAVTTFAKLTSKNQLTLPKSLISAVGATDYFEVQVKNGQIILTPVRIQRADAVRSKLEELGLNEQDIADAAKWARQSKRRAR